VSLQPAPLPTQISAQLAAEEDVGIF